MTFRSSPDYQLISFDRLAPAEQEALNELKSDPGFYGILRPVEQRGKTMKSVNREMALLLYTLREPGPLPSFVASLNERQTLQDIARLVMDGILEVQDDDQFLTGPQAYALVSSADPTLGFQNTIAKLSDQALRYAVALAVDDPAVLAGRLYDYNRVPLSPGWRRMYPDSTAVARGLTGTATREKGWVVRESEKQSGWLYWMRPGRPPQTASPGPIYKLYVSPRPEALKETLDRLQVLLSNQPVQQFKVGADAEGLLRPDKIVVYFSELESLNRAGQKLVEGLQGIPAQGVPFSAEIGCDGLLSWGLDPPAPRSNSTLTPRVSWRLWVTNLLARGVAAAKQAKLAPGPARQFALDRLKLEGVDVETWVPSATIWRQTDSGEA